jgi:hypothetical protein
VRLNDAPATIKKVAVLYNSGTQANWTFLPLAYDSATGLWQARVDNLDVPVHVIGQVMKLSGVTGFGANKGENHTSFTDPPSSGPDIVIESPRAGALFEQNEAVTPVFSCSDEGGVRSCIGSPLVGGKLDTGTSGPRTFTVTATDLSGNVSTKSVPYYVRYTFQGFKPPVDNPPVINIAKLGSTIPIKWSLVDASGSFVSDLNAVTSVTSEKIKCPSATGDVIEETTTLGLTPLKYDAATNQYVYSWQTLKSWGTGCRRVWVAFADASPPRYADFQLK